MREGKGGEEGEREVREGGEEGGREGEREVRGGGEEEGREGGKEGGGRERGSIFPSVSFLFPPFPSSPPFPFSLISVLLPPVLLSTLPPSLPPPPLSLPPLPANMCCAVHP